MENLEKRAEQKSNILTLEGNSYSIIFIGSDSVHSRYVTSDDNLNDIDHQTVSTFTGAGTIIDSKDHNQILKFSFEPVSVAIMSSSGAKDPFSLKDVFDSSIAENPRDYADIVALSLLDLANTARANNQYTYSSTEPIRIMKATDSIVVNLVPFSRVLELVLAECL